MLAFGNDETGAGAGYSDATTTPVRDLHTGEIWGSTFAFDPAGDRLAIPLDRDIDYRAIGDKVLGFSPDGFGKETLKIRTAIRKHVIGLLASRLLVPAVWCSCIEGM
jgi:hypothetical protein